jgi:hypothetical protein
VGSADLSIDLLEAGYSTDTRVAVYDAFADQDMGWHTHSYAIQRLVPAHSAVLLRLSYSPQYERGGLDSDEL